MAGGSLWPSTVPPGRYRSTVRYCPAPGPARPGPRAQRHGPPGPGPPPRPVTDSVTGSIYCAGNRTV
eukprot:522642-Hanusia_phi.AAC.1